MRPSSNAIVYVGFLLVSVLQIHSTCLSQTASKLKLDLLVNDEISFESPLVVQLTNSSTETIRIDHPKSEAGFERLTIKLFEPKSNSSFVAKQSQLPGYSEQFYCGPNEKEPCEISIKPGARYKFRIDLNYRDMLEWEGIPAPNTKLKYTISAHIARMD